MALKTTIPESEARLVDWTKNTSTKTVTLIRQWPDIDATEADALVAGAASSYTDPKADNQSYSGAYQAVTNKALGTENRSVTIRQTLTRTYMGAGEADAITPALSITYHEDSGETVTRDLYFDLTLEQVNAVITAGKPANTDRTQTSGSDTPTPTGTTWRPSISGGSVDGAFNLTIESRLSRKMDTGWMDVTDSNGTYSRRIFSGLTKAEVDTIRGEISSSYQGRVNDTFMPNTGRYSGSAWRGPADGWSLAGFDTPSNYDYTLTVESGTYHVYHRTSTNPSNIATWINTAPAGNAERVGAATAGMPYIGKGLYRGTKIVKS